MGGICHNHKAFQKLASWEDVSESDVLKSDGRAATQHLFQGSEALVLLEESITEVQVAMNPKEVV